MSTQTPRPAGEAPVLAVFDFDGTLTYCDTLFPFLRHAMGRTWFWLKFASLVPTLLAYKAGRLDRDQAKEAVLRRYLRRWPEEKVRSMAENYVVTRLPRLLNPVALERLQWHARQGHDLVVVSASQDLYVAPCMSFHGVMDTIATRLEVVDGRMTGRMSGGNCYGPEKLFRLQRLVGDLEGRGLYVYGDSKGDLDLLAVARHPHFRPFRQRGHGAKSILTLLKALL
ncbi:MAG: HAD family hydrolase [Dehalococcoidia bacterium]